MATKSLRLREEFALCVWCDDDDDDDEEDDDDEDDEDEVQQAVHCVLTLI